MNEEDFEVWRTAQEVQAGRKEKERKDTKKKEMNYERVLQINEGLNEGKRGNT